MQRYEISADGFIEIRVVVDEEERDDNVYNLAAPGIEGHVIGRADVDNNYAPDVDLTRFNAQSLGISRRHAALVKYRDAIHLIDLGSMNGTFINDEQLTPHTAQVLHSGDQIRIASLNLTITQ